MVSVIIPVYNAAKTLHDCVQSLLEQTYSDYEIILVDDGSTDGSGELCDESVGLCREKGISCTAIHQENGGVSRARNCGIDHAAGEYFVFVDSDDTVDADYLENMVHAALVHPECGHIISGFRCTSHIRNYIYSETEDMSLADRKDYMTLYDRILVQGPCIALYRAEIIRKNCIRMREDLSLAEDILFNLDYLDALENTAICLVNRANYVYHNEGEGSLYRQFRSNLFEISGAVFSKIREEMIRWGITDDTAWVQYHNARFFSYCNNFENIFREQNPQSFHEKIAYNSKILKSSGFRDTLAACTVPVSRPLRLAYSSGNYLTVLAVEQLASQRRKLYRLGNRD